MLNTKLIAAAFIVSAIVTGYLLTKKSSYERGYSDASAEYEQIAAEREREVLAANIAIHQAVEQLSDNHLEALFDAQENTDAIINDINSGNQRLYVRTEKSSCEVPDDSTASGLDDGESYTELHGELAEKLIRETERADRAAIALQALQDYVNEITK